MYYYSGRTVLVIAHRLSTIKDADLIAVVANGKIAEVRFTALIWQIKLLIMMYLMETFR